MGRYVSAEKCVKALHDISKTDALLNFWLTIGFDHILLFNQIRTASISLRSAFGIAPSGAFWLGWGRYQGYRVFRCSAACGLCLRVFRELWKWFFLNWGKSHRNGEVEKMKAKDSVKIRINAVEKEKSLRIF